MNDDDPWPALEAAFPAGADLGPQLLALLATPTIADKSWIWRQYDHQLFLNTVVGPGADATVLRLRGTRRALALSTDGSARFTRLDPRVGGRLAVLEAARNVACVGAVPRAVVNCLNFGNPEHLAVMWAFAEVVDGISEACQAIGVPVIGGNVSFYNESQGSDIDPTPVIGLVGLVETLDTVPPAPALGADQHVVLLGATGIELGGSEWAAVVHGLPGGRPPAARLEPAGRLLDLVRSLVAERAVRGVHDCAEGGVGVALAEMAIAGGCGFTVTPPAGLPPAAWCFSESASRVVVTVDRGRPGLAARPSRRGRGPRRGPRRHGRSDASSSTARSTSTWTPPPAPGETRCLGRSVSPEPGGACPPTGVRTRDPRGILAPMGTRASVPGLGHACGIFGVYAPGQTVAQLAYLGLYALQHRGQESAGIAVSDGETITVVKDMGLVTQVFDERRLAPLDGHLAIGHNRYSTTGASTWRNAQPVYRSVGDAGFALGHNGNLTNTAVLADRLGMLPGMATPTVGVDSTTDSALIAELVAQEYPSVLRSDGRDLELALERVLPRLEGGFSLVLMDEAHLIAVRDRHGFWPLVLGRVEEAAGSWRARPPRSTSSAPTWCARSSRARWS